MNKDLNLLKEVSSYFTEETLKNIVAKENNVSVDNVEIFDWDFGEASAKGDSYLSVVNRVEVRSKVKNEISVMKLVVKSLPNNIGRRKTFRSVEFFHNEIIFYTKVIFYVFINKNKKKLIHIITNIFFRSLRNSKNS